MPTSSSAPFRAAGMGLCALLLATSCAVAQPLSREAWREDVGFLAKQLPALHKNLFYTLDQRQFEAEAAGIATGVDTWSEPEIRLALARLVASAANAHTSINALDGLPVYPIQLYRFPDGFYVVAAPGEHGDAIGTRVMSMNGEPIESVAKRLLPLVPRETPSMEKLYLPDLLRSAAAVGAAHVELTLEKDGRQWNLALDAGPEQGLPPLERGSFPVPLYLSNRNSSYWFRYLADSRTLYVQYNRCRDDKGKPFSGFVGEVMAVADREPLDRIVLDLRQNGGGDSAVIRPLFVELKMRPKLTRKGHLYVLVGRRTFSSAFIAEWQMKQDFNAILAGEPSAQRPNSYGDVRSFQLPNSKLRVQYCTKFFQLSAGNPDSLPVDVQVELTARDYFSGRDPVLERIAMSR
jgi:hypothetical protein